MRRRRLALVALAASLLVPGCSAPPEGPEDTPVTYVVHNEAANRTEVVLGVEVPPDGNASTVEACTERLMLEPNASSVRECTAPFNEPGTVISLQVVEPWSDNVTIQRLTTRVLSTPDDDPDAVYEVVLGPGPNATLDCSDGYVCDADVDDG